jgi:hypothetical protein
MFSLLGCESENIAPQDTRLGIEYFPLTVGNYSVYWVEDIHYAFGKDPDTSRYQLKEVVADSFPGEGSEIVYRLEFRFHLDLPEKSEPGCGSRK